MLEFFRKLFSGSDNQTPEILRVCGGIGLFLLYWLQVYAIIILHQPFDAVAFAKSISLVIGALGVGIAVKSYVSPGGTC